MPDYFSLVAQCPGDRTTDRRPPLRARSILPPAVPVCHWLGQCHRPRRRSTAARSRFVFRWPWQKYYLDARGLYRVFNATEYRFYRSPFGPPSESAEPFATSSSLPATPTDTYADGTWYLSVSYFNGVIDSGFLPLGPQGETCLTVTIAGGVAESDPPAGPLSWRIEARPAGVVRILAFYFVDTVSRADQWSIAYTVDGSTPAEDSPDLTEDLAASGLAVLSYDLPAAADAATVSVRLQTRRNDGTESVPIWVYSNQSTVLTIAADATGPTAPPSIQTWPGQPVVSG